MTLDAIHAEYNNRLHQWSDIQDQLPYIHVAAQATRYPTIIEIGVRTGFSTCALLSGAHYMRGQLWSCDINDPDVPAPWHADPRWHFKKGSSVSDEVLAWMPPRADLIMIDSGHDQELTLQELRAYHPRLRGEGVVLVHDTQFMPPNISLPEVGGPVYEAIRQYIDEIGSHVTLLLRHSEPGFYGMGVISRDQFLAGLLLQQRLHVRLLVSQGGGPRLPSARFPGLLLSQEQPDGMATCQVTIGHRRRSGTGSSAHSLQ